MRLSELESQQSESVHSKDTIHQEMEDMRKELAAALDKVSDVEAKNKELSAKVEQLQVCGYACVCVCVCS